VNGKKAGSTRDAAPEPGRNRGKGSGLKTEIHYAAVYTFRHGKGVHGQGIQHLEYNTCAEALEAVGLSQQDAQHLTTKPE
jgi:hypothetical protein